jgi:hypothetical protein
MPIFANDGSIPPYRPEQGNRNWDGAMSDLTTGGFLDRFERVWQEQLVLCDRLEAIADSLPDNIDRQGCIHTARALGPLISRAHKLEEEELFPVLEGAGFLPIDPKPSLERLKLEHAGDECFAEELTEVLLSYGSGDPTHGAEATGYMLRGFFEALRRHIAHERELAVGLQKVLESRSTRTLLN